VPDLQLEASKMNTARVSSENIPAKDCQVVEGCVAQAGQRTLLRFPTYAANLGTGDLVMPPVPADGVSDATYEWSPCHMHHHVRGFANFELVDPVTGVVATARKQAFCLEDSQPVTIGGEGGKFTCGSQGISVGWVDVYADTLACEYIDVTDQPPGKYTLRVTLNPDHILPDSNPDNNVFTMPVMLPAPAP